MSKPKTKTVNTDELVRRFTEYGPFSNEFAEYCKNFIVFLQMRYMGWVDEDCQQLCWRKLMASFSYYDAERGANLATWVYSVVRNEISGFLYRRKRELNQVPLDDDSLKGEEGVEFLSVDPDRGDYTEEQTQWIFKSFKRLDVQWVGKGDTSDGLRDLGFQNALVRTILWENMIFDSTYQGTPSP